MRYNWYSIGERIRECRTKAGYSQEQLASKMDVILLSNENDDRPLSRGLVGRWENGQPIKKVEHVAALAEVFKCDIGYILCEYDTKHAKDAEINSMTGLPPVVTDRLIEYKQEESHFLEVISLLLMDENLLQQIFDCTLSNYVETSKKQSDLVNDHLSDLMSSGHLLSPRQMILSPEKLEEIDSIMLYDRLKEFIGNARTLRKAAEDGGLLPFEYREILSSIKSASPAPKVAPNSAPK